MTILMADGVMQGLQVGQKIHVNHSRHLLSPLSPAFGEIDGYGVSLHMSVTQAVRLWGHPTTREEITNIFLKHIAGELEAIPWSEQGLNEETGSIQAELLKLNRKGWWTVASQPAVNGVRSDDKVFGWGPRGGFVFQKVV